MPRRRRGANVFLSRATHAKWGDIWALANQDIEIPPGPPFNGGDPSSAKLLSLAKGGWEGFLKKSRRPRRSGEGDALDLQGQDKPGSSCGNQPRPWFERRGRRLYAQTQYKRLILKINNQLLTINY
jgi:hypothetical protein